MAKGLCPGVDRPRRKESVEKRGRGRERDQHSPGYVENPVSGSPSSSVNLSPPPHFQETNKLNIQVPVGSYESTSSHNSEQSFSLYL